MDLRLGDCCQYPWLVSVVPGKAWASVEGKDGLKARVCRATEVTDPLRAAAILLADPLPEEASAPVLKQMIERVTPYPELLARLSEKLDSPFRVAGPRSRQDERLSWAIACGLDVRGVQSPSSPSSRFSR